MSSHEISEVRLSPKAEVRAIRHGYPWVYGNELVLDRRTKAIPPGSVVRLMAADGVALGMAAFNANSKITARLLDRNAEAVIDRAWLEAKLHAALALRTRLFSGPFYRLVHAEADGFPGVIIDRFGDAAVIQPNAAWAEVMIDDLSAALQAVTGVKTVLKSASGRARALEGLDDVSTVLAGGVDGPVPVEMNGAIYMADLMGGQKTGLFYDQRPNHAFVARLAKGQRVLDVFSHVGGFALAALASGAEHAIAVDGSEPALDLAREGASRMGKSGQFETEKSDAFQSLERRSESAEKFGIVICDPPAFAPNKPALEAGLRAYERVARLAALLVEPGGYLCLNSCSHAVDLNAFRLASIRGIGRAGRSSQIIHTGYAGPDHPVHPQLAESGYLKSLVFRLA
jgi:23S rRNA (cytosine1962-C5)-methyltransferase